MTHLETNRLFRAWSEEEQTMDKFHSFSEFCKCHKSLAEDAVLMQCTGLFDKEGTAIYESDIVSTQYISVDTPARPINYVNIYVVEFGVQEIDDNEMYGSNTSVGFYLRALEKEAWGRYSHFDIRLSEARVLGNIYQNKDLLPDE